MAEHEGCQWLLMLGEVAPEEVGLDGAIRIVVAKIWNKCFWVCKGRCEAIRDTAEMNWEQWRVVLQKGSNWQDGFP